MWSAEKLADTIKRGTTLADKDSLVVSNFQNTSKETVNHQDSEDVEKR
jgi:hypothetical protein